MRTISILLCLFSLSAHAFEDQFERDRRDEVCALLELFLPNTPEAQWYRDLLPAKVAEAARAIRDQAWFKRSQSPWPWVGRAEVEYTREAKEIAGRAFDSFKLMVEAPRKSATNAHFAKLLGDLIELGAMLGTYEGNHPAQKVFGWTTTVLPVTAGVGATTIASGVIATFAGYNNFFTQHLDQVAAAAMAVTATGLTTLAMRQNGQPFLWARDFDRTPGARRIEAEFWTELQRRIEGDDTIGYIRSDSPHQSFEAYFGSRLLLLGDGAAACAKLLAAPGPR